MNDQELMAAIDQAYKNARSCSVYVGGDPAKATAAGQRAAKCAQEWMMLRAEARKRGLLPPIGEATHD